MLTQIVKQALSILTILCHITIPILIILGIKNLSIKNKLKKYYTQISLMIASTATLGSLYFSEVAKWDPCKLCWFQRIFMYPLVLIFFIAVIKKDKRVYRYAIPMSIIGGGISAYHYLINLIPVTGPEVCSTTGANCLVKYFTEFGYVTIPMMAFTAFVVILILSTLSYKK